jgi:quercetin dioxygenase-like cupin family protein
MPVSGDTIENPHIGEKVIFRETAKETDGRLLRFDFLLSEGARQPSSHRHMEQESRFKVVSGELGARLGGGRPRVYRPGETLIVPAGTHHLIWNAVRGETSALVEIEPAGNFEQFLETIFGLMRDGRMHGNGPIPRPYLHSALLASANQIYISGVPLSLQRPGIWLMARLAKLRGYRLSYPEYSGGATADAELA